MKPDHTSAQAILDLVRGLRDIEQRAAQQCRPVVHDILRTGSRDVQHIERTHEAVLRAASVMMFQTETV